MATEAASLSSVGTSVGASVGEEVVGEGVSNKACVF